MKNLVIFLFLFVNLLFSQYATEKDLVGIWAGTLKIQSIELRIVVKFELQDDNTIKVLLDSPDQGAKNIKVDKFSLSEDKLTLEIKSIMAKYEGDVFLQNSLIVGYLIQANMKIPLDLKRQKEEIKINRPQEPKPPFNYLEEEVEFKNEKANITLSGTLTLPKGNGPFKAVVLVTGSGPQNRNEELMGHKPFLVIADYLTKNGIAVLRYDDRGVGKSKGVFSEGTTLDFADDAEAAFEFLKSNPLIDKNKIGIIGHSEGGIIAPIVASRNSSVAFVILLAGTGMTGEDILLAQAELIAKANNEDKDKIEEDLKSSKKIYTLIKTEKDETKLEEAIKEELKKGYERESKDQSSNETIVNAQLKTILSKWFRMFLVLDPKEYLSKVKCPILAVNGTRDLQVPADDNLKAIYDAVSKSGNTQIKIKKFDGLNHLFQKATTGSPNEYSKIEETFSEDVLKYILDFIEELN